VRLRFSAGGFLAGRYANPSRPLLYSSTRRWGVNLWGCNFVCPGILREDNDRSRLGLPQLQPYPLVQHTSPIQSYSSRVGIRHKAVTASKQPLKRSQAPPERCCSLTTILLSNWFKPPPAAPDLARYLFLHSFLSWIPSRLEGPGLTLFRISHRHARRTDSAKPPHVRTEILPLCKRAAPPRNTQWRGADSHRGVRFACFSTPRPECSGSSPNLAESLARCIRATLPRSIRYSRTRCTRRSQSTVSGPRYRDLSLLDTRSLSIRSPLRIRRN
jgi:hypothetical protein